MGNVIEVNKVSKTFRLPYERHSSLKQIFVNPVGFFKKSSSSQRALKDISFEVKEGEFLGIVGRNGSGKSTLLKILAGIYQPTKGGISIKGKVMPFIELGVGFSPELTGQENVFLSGALLGFSREEIRKRYKSIVEFAELEDFMGQKLKNYSSGMQVRLAFSIAIQAEADVLLIDEVLAVGDAAFQRKCYEYFKKLKRDKRTVVFVTHDMDAVREYCDRAIMIEDSRKVLDASPSDVAREYGLIFQGEDDEQLEMSEDRYGNNAVKFTNLSVPRLVTDNDKAIEIGFDINIKKDIDNLVLGIAIKDSTGLFICGTNTRLLKMSTGKIISGKNNRFTWKVPNIFHDGMHSITIAATDNTEVNKYDWWEGAANFSVKRGYHVPYPAQPNIRLHIK